MDSFQFWLYVIIAIIYVLSRALKKKDQSPAEPPGDYEQRQFSPPPKTSSSTPGERPLTFEELLREITESKKQQAPEPYSRSVSTSKRTEYVDYDEDLKEEAEGLETIGEEDYRKREDAIYDVYENAKKQAFSQPSLEESLSLMDTDVKFGKFKAFETSEEKSVLDNYLKDFRDPEGLKKAVVMSEILKRKF